MTTFDILIDLANTTVFRGVASPNPALVGARLDDLVSRLSSAVLDALGGGPHELRLRLYDGWMDSMGRPTPVHLLLREHVQSAYPRRYGRALRIFVTIATSLLAAPTDDLSDTYRRELGFGRSYGNISKHSPPTCANRADCSLEALRAWHSGSCPQTPACPIRDTDVVTIDSQKMVDTSLVSDAVWAASDGRHVILVSNDEDVIPGLLTARYYDTFVAWATFTSPPREPFRSLLKRYGVEHLQC